MESRHIRRSYFFALFGKEITPFSIERRKIHMIDEMKDVWSSDRWNRIYEKNNI